MNPVHPSAEGPSVPAETPVSPAAPLPAVGDRLNHLFRASLKSGRVHPLYLPVLRYRHTRDGA